MADRKTIEKKLAELDIDDLTPVRGIPIPIDVHHVDERVKTLGLEARAKMAVLARELDAQNVQTVGLTKSIVELDACVDRRFDKLTADLADHHKTISKRIDDQDAVQVEQGKKLGEIGVHVSDLVFVARENTHAEITLKTAQKQADINDEADKKKNRRERWTKVIGAGLGIVGLIELFLTHVHC